jgi:hypothetical protein
MNLYPFVKRIILIWFLAAVLLSGCASGKKTTYQISEHYKQNHDYDSLVALVPQLNLVMSRSEVENLLGTPIVCPLTGQCFYISDKTVIVSCVDESNVSHSTCQSFPLMLVVSYSIVGEYVASPQDRLVGIYLGPVGE